MNYEDYEDLKKATADFKNHVKTAGKNDGLQARFEKVMQEWLKEFSVEMQKKLKNEDLARSARYVEVVTAKDIGAKSSDATTIIKFELEAQRFKDKSSNKHHIFGWIEAQVRPTHMNMIPYTIKLDGERSWTTQDTTTSSPSTAALRMTFDISRALDKVIPDVWQYFRSPDVP